MTDKELVKALIDDPNLSDVLIDFYLDLSRQFIKNYCHIDEIPEGLHNTMIQIAAIKLKANTEDGKSTLGMGVSSITSLSEAGQSISWGRVTSSKNFIGDDDLITTFETILNRYKRMDSGVVHRCRRSPVRVRRFL